MAASTLLQFLQTLPIDPAQEPVAAPLVVEIRGRLRFLIEVGLDYLALGRGSDTLSGGELQRARLAASSARGWSASATILDEPTAGLHPRDTARLIASLRRLQKQGNSLLVVEHDASVIRAADWVVDLGPGAGPDGGARRCSGDARPVGPGQRLDHRPVPRPAVPTRRDARRPRALARSRAGSKSATPPSIT